MTRDALLADLHRALDADLSRAFERALDGARGPVPRSIVLDRAVEPLTAAFPDRATKILDAMIRELWPDGVLYGAFVYEPTRDPPDALDYVQEGRPSLIVRSAHISPRRGMRIILAKPETWFGIHDEDDIRPHLRNLCSQRQARFVIAANGETRVVDGGSVYQTRIFRARPRRFSRRDEAAGPQWEVVEHALEEAPVLVDGDRVGLGAVELEFLSATAPRETPPR